MSGVFGAFSPPEVPTVISADVPRFLNMLSGLESLISLGKCRELPVVGFIDGVLVMGIIVSPRVSALLVLNLTRCRTSLLASR